MSKLPLFLWCLIALYINTTAQDQPDAQDSLLLQQLKMKKYDKDTSAEAVVLSDIGSVYIRAEGYGFTKFFIRHLKIKILSEAGLSNGTFAIPLFNHNNFGEDITFIEAATYNLENGKVDCTHFHNSELYEEKFGPVTIDRIAMPNVKVGSVIYISFTIKSPYTGYFNWTFQHNIPVVLSAFNLVMPPFLHYKSLMQNMDTISLIHLKQQNTPQSVFSNPGFSGTDRYDDIMYTYAYKDIPAFKDEAFISCQEDYLIQIGFQLSTWEHEASFTNTWQRFTDRLLLDLTYFGGYLYSKEHFLTKTAEQLKLDGRPGVEKIKTIINYVKANYKWNNAYDVLSDKKMDDFIIQKSGNSAAINLFLTALLKAADIDAEPVLLSTRSHGKIKSNYPFASFFNDVICYVKTDSLALLLDATEPSLPYFAIPPECANGFGYIVQKNDSGWVDLKPQMSAGIMENLLIKFSRNLDSINCKFSIKANGYSGYSYRKDCNEGYDNFSSKLAKSKGMDLLDSIKVYSLDKTEEPFSIIFSAASYLMKEKTDSSVVSRMIFSPFLNEPISDNPLKMPDRKYPVDMEYPRDFKYNSIVVIPSGFKLSEKPAEVNSSVDKNKATFTYKVKQISDSVFQFTSDLSFNVPVYQPTDYKELKSLYDLAIKKCKEPIILVKE
jgi:Domain of Unknown Function with PDB structure (DUF3857)